ncbi:MAG: UvrB/UvrC motif-containing protein, partial [Elusimicrobiales bacterium]|nr:UvrB/UvrC motif-containing protein [Elusimicrobiales bacterium]
HTGQCPAPCDGQISHDDYNVLVERIRDFLKGDFEKLADECRQEMKKASDDMRYEEAAQYRDFLSAFSFLKERVRFRRLTPDYVEQATARSNSVTELQRALKLKKPPVHIECFDTSHLFGRQAVGSSSCFVNGEKCTQFYRHYKIEFENTPTGGNDFAMMEEIVFRRLRQIQKRGEDFPDLFVIDGGPGQLASAVSAMRRAKFRIPVISLAKRLEEVYFPGNPTPILLPRDNAGLQLLQALRDEAHRFGITFHRKLRAKAELSEEN